MSVKFLLWLQYNKGFSHRDAMDIIKRLNLSKETDLDKRLMFEFLDRKDPVLDPEPEGVIT